MPRYIVERTVPKMSQEEWRDVGNRVVQSAAEMPGVTWIKCSISESEGKTYCEFEAPNAESLREHSRRASLPYDRVIPVEMQVDPSMFR
ncbi:DUF4242 domain-containing protein [Haliangium ochraceum]|uniref:DUF4242 domain-containing protein n=1 Tax=Haliangium ochraceum (strain DSM 14365 / JCM 11303 / SMP-2) TaxID=502025 RepID=D0LJ18_HALO1|nr:DUF4242 domain-containing protein [Haliangium ochraceum]ACY13047.1 conserved hypothetical protein [Haliangium ochraceum DSM 14365]